MAGAFVCETNSGTESNVFLLPNTTQNRSKQILKNIKTHLLHGSYQCELVYVAHVQK